MENGTVLGILIACIALSIFVTYSMLGGITVDAPEVDLTGLATTEEVIIIVSSAVEALKTVDNVSDNQALAFDGEYILTKDEFEEEATEAEALRLATELLDESTFMKKLKNVLNVEINKSNSEIDHRRDITRIEILDIEYDEEEKSVKVDFKIYFFIEDDEEEEYKARATIIVDFRNLDFDDDFEDAEVKNSYKDSFDVRYIREL